MSALELGPGALYATAGSVLSGVAVLTLEGELDVYTRPILLGRARMLLDDGATVLILDMEKVSFADSVGLGTFVTINKEARAAGGGVVLAAPRDADRKTLGITGLDKVFLAVCDTVAEAHTVLRAQEAA
jgi:anti-sigma B factor antagonist